MSDFGLSAEGYIAPRQADFLTTIRDQYETELLALGFTVLPDWERDVFLSSVTEIMSSLLGQLGEASQSVYDARSIANATGLQLSNLALIVGVERQEATRGTVTLRCSGDDGTSITQGKIAEGGGAAGTTRWACTSDGTIGDVVSGYVDLVFECEDDGQIVATAGEIVSIVTPVDGWDSVTNLAAADPGQDRETDAQLRTRRQQALQASGATSVNAIRAALLALDFVTGVVVVDNKTELTVVVDGISLDPYSVGAVVAPDSMTVDQQEEVVRAVYEHLGAGTATSGDQSGTVTKADTREETINFYFAVDTAVNVAWVLALEPGFVIADVEEELLALVTDLFLTFGPGTTVYPTPLIALAASIDGIANVTSLLLNGGAAPEAHDSNELPILGTHTVA